MLIQYLQIACTMCIGSDHCTTKQHRGAISWIISSPGKEQLVLNAGPVDGLHNNKCQSSLCSTITGLASVTLLYLQELANFHSLIIIQSKFWLYVASIGAIKYVSAIRNLIPTRMFTNSADLPSTLHQAAPEVLLTTYCWCHVPSHQDANTEFYLLPISEQLNMLCKCMTTCQLQCQGAGSESLSTTSSSWSLLGYPKHAVTLYHSSARRD